MSPGPHAAQLAPHNSTAQCRSGERRVKWLLTRALQVLHAPWVDYLLLKNAVSRTLFNPQMKIISRTASIVASRMSSISTSGIDDNHDMLSKLIEIHQQRPEEIPARRLTSYVATNILAGSDTTAVTLRSIIYYCLKSPDGVVCRRLQKEIDDADLKMPSPLSDAMHLDYLDSVLKESMRCHFIGKQQTLSILHIQRILRGYWRPYGSIIRLRCPTRSCLAAIVVDHSRLINCV